MFHALCVGSSIARQLAADQTLKLVGHTSTRLLFANHRRIHLDGFPQRRKRPVAR